MAETNCIVDIPSIPTLVCGNFCSLSISEEREVYSWGINDYCKLGHDNGTRHVKLPTKIPNLYDIKMIAVGYDHTACCDFTGNVFTFGCNTDGQLGRENSNIPEKIKNLPPIDKIYCGSEMTLCLTQDGELYSFGRGDKGELGTGKTDHSSPVKIPKLSNIEEAYCNGSNHVFCKSYDNELYGWGRNDKGQLGIGTNTNQQTPILITTIPDQIASIKCGNSFSLFLCHSGFVYSSGHNNYLQCGHKNISKLNLPKKIEDIPLIKIIESGLYHSICIDEDDNLWGFGYNYCGQLGYDNCNPSQPTLVENIKEINAIKDIVSGDFHSYIKTINNEIYAFGRNDNSQLGVESEKYQFKPIKIFEDKEDIWCERYRKSRAKSARK